LASPREVMSIFSTRMYQMFIILKFAINRFPPSTYSQKSMLPPSTYLHQASIIPMFAINRFGRTLRDVVSPISSPLVPGSTCLQGWIESRPGIELFLAFRLRSEVMSSIIILFFLWQRRICLYQPGNRRKLIFRQLKID